MSDGLAAIAARIRDARRITILTGAGVSAASGVPTFRGPGGLWRSYRPEELATPEAFRRDPRLVWEWYDWRRGLIARCEPNAAHHVLARWSAQGTTLITQNVDGLHERAGARDVVRFHGSLWRLRCAEECGQPEWEDASVPLEILPPPCPACGGLARPAVVWFGEPIDPDVLERCARAIDCDLFLSIGTSSVVYPAAGLVHAARRQGAFTVEINPEATEAAAAVDAALSMPAEVALPQLEALGVRA
ncbi:MAG TPA: NAD-dependent deacylase [Vicinamibacterales bacterium]|nr:NAD-dependent deacylase [Vicinamibacterales bacterium]